MRKTLSKRLRFEILKRDDFRCRYCGAKQPDAELRVDHVCPVVEGGTNDAANLVTACNTCNAGKADVLLELRRLEPAPTNPITAYVDKVCRRARLLAKWGALRARGELV